LLPSQPWHYSELINLRNFLTTHGSQNKQIILDFLAAYSKGSA
jgi:hypothetical protein